MYMFSSGMGCNPDARLSMYRRAKDSRSFLYRFKLGRSSGTMHNGCVNTVCFNDTGTLVLSGADDQHLCIADSSNFKLKTRINTSHRSNIFCARFMPLSNDEKVVSCSGDGRLIVTDVNRSSDVENEVSSPIILDCHFGTVYKICTIPGDPNCFLSAGEDGTIRLFDLRTRTSCNRRNCKEDIIVSDKRAATSICVTALRPWELAVGLSDSMVCLFDRRCLSTGTAAIDGAARQAGFLNKFCPPELANTHHRITSLTYSADASRLLASYSADYIYLFSLRGGEGKTMAYSETDCKNANNATSPKMKKLRLRGDWSDTGPSARPQFDQPESSGSSQNNPDPAIVRPSAASLNALFMERISQVFSRLIESAEMPNRPARRFRQRLQERRRLRLEEEAMRAARERELAEGRESAASEMRSDRTNSVGSTDSTSFRTPRTEDCEDDWDDRRSSVVPDSEGSVMEALDDIEEEIATSSITEPMLDVLYTGEGSTSGRISLSRAEPPTAAEVDMVPDVGLTEEEAVPESMQTFREVDADDQIIKTTGSFIDLPPLSCDDGIANSEKPVVLQKFVGHRNSRTMIKESNFWGDKYVMSGSDCGHVFFWDVNSGSVVNLLEADRHVVNCVQPHPFDPVLLTSGIDYDYKLWIPTDIEGKYDERYTSEIMRRNEIMLEESRDTITVPASFMIRMLATMPQLSAMQGEEETGNSNIRQSNDEEEDDDE